jgi:hypothetical protein
MAIPRQRLRGWKMNVIEKTNLHWNDLSAKWLDPATSRRMTHAECSTLA